MYPTLKEAYFAKKVVLVRTGFDVPLGPDGEILDDRRIRLSVPTIKYLLDHQAKHIIIITHMGRPDTKDPNPHLKTDVLAGRLGDLLEIPIIKVDGFSDIPAERIVMLENLRFDKREKSKDMIQRDAFGKELAALADIYVNDSFSTCHRNHASMTSIPKFLPGVIGLSVEKEVSTISDTLASPNHPFVSVIGGLKADKLNAVSNILKKVDRILIGGALGFSILKARGLDVGKTKIDSEGLSSMQDILRIVKDNDKIVLPKDCLVAKEFSADAMPGVCDADSIPNDSMALDIGPKSVREYTEILNTAKTIVWNGPIGVFEFDNFSKGTSAVAHAIADNPGVTIVGGGDSADAIDKLGLADQMTLVSSGGGASLQMFEGKELVALKALKKYGKEDKEVGKDKEVGNV